METIIISIVFISMIILLIIDKWKPSLIFGGAAIFLMAFGIITPQKYLTGFVNESIIIIFLLIIITSVINEHFNFLNILGKYLNSANNPRNFLFRVGIGVGCISSVINNTPIVAFLLPYVYNWAKKKNIAPSLVLIPLSYMTVLGGMITVIGTSTNLVLNGLIVSKGLTPLSTYDYFIPGLLVTISGVIFIAGIGYTFLPKNKDIISEAQQNIKEYIVETELEHNSLLIGKTIEEASLRNLDGIFLIEILRQSKIISPVEPNETLIGGDRLFFAGETSKVIKLINQKNGLTIPVENKQTNSNGLEIVEIVIPSNSELVGKSLKDFQFRNKYDAAVIAIHRNGERVRGKIGEIELDKGDLLMLTVGKNFALKNNFDKNFYLISFLNKINKPSRNKSFIAPIGLLILVSLLIFGKITFFIFLLLLICLLYALNLTSFEHIKKQVSLDLLIILGSSISISEALTNSNFSNNLSNIIPQIIDVKNPIWGIILLYIITLIITSFITNTAAVAIMFPIAFSFIPLLNINTSAIFLTISFGASCCFLTPIAYQTNLMVYGPGNYKFRDYFKLGIPLTIIYSGLSLSWIIYYYL
jgi:di/tricarboxylate transporter